MKKILLLATAFAFTLVAVAQPAQPKTDDVIKMNAETHDFGKIKQNEPVTFVFEIKNISDKPVVVESTSASCGCTTPEKPTEPILPGAVGKVKVVYNAAAVGAFTKDVFIKLAGIDAQKIVHITGEVVAPQPQATDGAAATAPAVTKPAVNPDSREAAKPVTPANTAKPKLVNSKGN
ncbi:MAG: DUF1573 domain-containing protein [Bacteroidota bacterium]